MDISAIGIGFALGFSFLIIYSRKSRWFNPKLVWTINITVVSISIYGLFFSNLNERKHLTFFCHLLIPFIYWCFDRFFKYLSFKLHKRDFYLYLRYSDEIDYSFGGKNPHVKITDKLFSILLIVIIVFGMLGTIAIFK